jgi:hypothetical protein
MSLDLSAYDDAALEAIAPKGVVRRARRDFEAGVATVRERTGSTAVVDAEGQTVTIDARGPKAARCTCPAGGVCRHILVAVMAVNAAAVPATPEATETGPSAADEICALTQAELTAFAGADWATAITLAAASAESPIVESGRNCTVELAGAPTGVTFIAGLGLKGAAFKGAKSRRRVVVTASAILLRQKRGIALDAAEAEPATAKDGVTQDYLDDAAQKLARSVRIVLKAASPVAADILFDLAISARAEAAPRLTAKLRGLARQAGRAATRDVQFEPDAFLAEAATTFALIQALKVQPTEAALTGAVRRDYEAAPAFELWMLGATTWRTDTGARGLTLHGFAPADRRWRSVSIARGAGMDPSFDPRAAYRMPLWGAGVANGLMGRGLHLAEPLVAGDQTIAPSLKQAAVLGSSIRNLNALIEAGAAATAWHVVRQDLSLRLGDGLRRRPTPVPVLLAPASYGGLAFNDFAQCYEWDVFDAAGDRLLFSMPSDAHELARRLSGTALRSHLVLAEARADLGRPVLTPITVLFNAANGVEVVNFDLDYWSQSGSLQAALNAATQLITRRAPPTAAARGPLLDLSRRALDAAVSTCAGAQVADVNDISRGCEAAGLLALASAVDRMEVRKNIESSLATAYLASEVAASMQWG